MGDVCETVDVFVRYVAPKRIEMGIRREWGSLIIEWRSDRVRCPSQLMPVVLKLCRNLKSHAS